eukprot:bmy_17358T0
MPLPFCDITASLPSGSFPDNLNNVMPSQPPLGNMLPPNSPKSLRQLTFEIAPQVEVGDHTWGRRSDPNFKNRLREQRKKQKLAKERAGLSKLPDLKDAEAVQKFFLEEIQLGEELLPQGEYEKGVDHLTNAIAVCGQPQQLLQVLQQTLPPPVFQRLLTKLPTISQRIV